MTADKEKALDKIKKLLRLANDRAASENEVELALKAAHKLMVQHNISEADTLGRESANVDEVRIKIPSEYDRQELHKGLIHVIAENYICEVLTATEGKNRYCYLFGLNDQVKIVVELYKFAAPKYDLRKEFRWREYANKKQRAFLGASVQKIIEAGQMETQRSYKLSYIHGVMDGVSIALTNEQEKAMKIESYGLIVRQSIAVIQKEVARLYPNVKTEKKRGRIIDADAYHTGLCDGENLRSK